MYLGLSPRKEESTMSETSPLEAQLEQVLSAHARREDREAALRATPRWRLRRRRYLKRSIRGRQEWEQAVREGLISSSGGRDKPPG